MPVEQRLDAPLDEALVGSETDTTADAKATTATNRLASLDVYRGFVMMALATEGYIPAIAGKFPDSSFWQEMGRQFAHVQWEGGVFWDLIQPSFMFIVGVAMAYSYYSRRRKGDNAWKIAAHVLYRAAVLVGLGLLLVSMPYQRTNFEFTDILSQIGLAYPFAYLLVGRTARVQLAVAAGILIVYWLAFYLYLLPSPNFDYSSLGIQDLGKRFEGLYAHWNRYTNFADAFDRWFLNLFPRSAPFLHDPLGLATLNFVPSIVTLLSGIMAGELLRGPRQPTEKFLRLCVSGLGCLVAGLILGYTVCPIIKAIWTPSWVLVSAGFTFFLLALFYWITEIKGFVGLMFPLIVVGMNSLAMYLMIRLSREWLWRTVGLHLVNFRELKHIWPVEAATVALAMWLVCFWMYRRKIFIRL
jgi:predicted acyltransferase